MPYTVWSRGRLIGETDLGFVRIINRCRSGWFHPNAEGERTMPVIASVLPAMRAYLHRNEVDAKGDSLVQPALHGSTLFADLAEAFQHLSSLDLELRREDGLLVPTADIGIQDMEQLLELAPLDDDESDAVDDAADDDLLETLEPPVDDLFAEWTPDDLEEPQLPRYQIHVMLMHDDAIP